MLALYLKCSGQEAKKHAKVVQAQLCTPGIECSLYCIGKARALARGDVVLSKMTFAVGRIRKCTLKLKLLVILFCSPTVGLSYHEKCWRL